MDYFSDFENATCKAIDLFSSLFLIYVILSVIILFSYSMIQSGLKVWSILKINEKVGNHCKIMQVGVECFSRGKALFHQIKDLVPFIYWLTKLSQKYYEKNHRKLKPTVAKHFICPMQ